MSYLLEGVKPPAAVPGKNQNGKRNHWPPGMVDFVWRDWNGDKPSALCMCCEKVTIVRYDTKRGWTCGHIISVENGGWHDVMNLRPICGSCNSSMREENMYDYKLRKYPNTLDSEHQEYIKEDLQTFNMGKKFGATILH
jgi:hypothetical protein